MRAFHLHRRGFAWVAILAVVVAALLPAISHALAGADGAQRMALCTAQGVRFVALGDDPAAPPADRAMAHCPYCASHAPALGMPPAALSVLPPAHPQEQPAASTPCAERSVDAWPSAQARAPPTSR